MPERVLWICLKGGCAWLTADGVREEARGVSEGDRSELISMLSGFYQVVCVLGSVINNAMFECMRPPLVQLGFEQVLRPCSLVARTGYNTPVEMYRHQSRCFQATGDGDAGWWCINLQRMLLAIKKVRLPGLLEFVCEGSGNESREGSRGLWILQEVGLSPSQFFHRWSQGYSSDQQHARRSS